MAVGAVVARILTQYSDKGSKAAQKDIAKLGKQFDAFAKKTAKAFGVAAAAVGAFAIKVGKDAVQAAIADQKSQALLANSLRNTVGATDAAIASVEDYISKLQLQVGVADDDLRPALSRLAAVTGDVAAAQQLLGLALDVSAFSGADLGTASTAVTRALQGNFKSLQKLVPSISTATIKSKDLAAIFAEVQKATSGAAGARANTLEYRLRILRIRYSEILETLGYKLIPVIEQFARVIQDKVLPQLEIWIATNSTKLVNALQLVSDAVVKIILAGIQLADWISNNMGLIKGFAAVLATMFTLGKIATFITTIKTLSSAFAALRASAAGAAIATAFATGGASVVAATAALAAVGGAAAIYAGLKSEGNKARKRKTGAIGNYAMSTGSVSSLTSSSKKINPQVSLLDSITKAQNNLTAAEKKSASAKEKLTKTQIKYNDILAKMGIKTTEQQEAITQFAIVANLKKQAAISGNALTSIGSRLPMNLKSAGTGDINVYVQGSVISERDLVTVVTQAQQKKTTTGAPIGSKYDNGFGGGGGFFRTQVL
jgi:hypothetical protein